MKHNEDKIHFWHNQLMQLILGKDYVKTENMGSPSARVQSILNESSNTSLAKSNFLQALNEILVEIEYDIIESKERLTDIIDLIINFKPFGGLAFLVKYQDLCKAFNLNSQLLSALGNYFQSVPDKEQYPISSSQYNRLLKESLSPENDLITATAIFKMLHLEFFVTVSQMCEVLDDFLNTTRAKMVIRSIRDNKESATQLEVDFIKYVEQYSEKLQISSDKIDFELVPKYDGLHRMNSLLQAQMILNSIKKERNKQAAFDARFQLRDRDVLNDFMVLASSESISPIKGVLISCISEAEQREGFMDFERLGFKISRLKSGGLVVKNLKEEQEISPIEIAKNRIGRPRSVMLGKAVSLQSSRDLSLQGV